MHEEIEEFDPAPFEVCEWEVLPVLAQHIAALSPGELWWLKEQGAILMNLRALETGREFTLQDLTIAFVGAHESVGDVERRVGKDWISSFSWLEDEPEETAAPDAGRRHLRHQEVLMQVMEYDWFELVMWNLEERWIDGTG